MDALFDFISQYWFIVAIVISAIYSVFSKSTKKASGGGTKMPSFGGSGEAGTPLFDSEPRTVARSEHPTAPHMGGRIDEAPARPTRPLADTSHHTERRVMEVRTAESDISAGDLTRSLQRNGPRPSKHALVQGVLWAEILGPPRAKKKQIR